jgi:hypothetical protein
MRKITKSTILIMKGGQNEIIFEPRTVKNNNIVWVEIDSDPNFSQYVVTISDDGDLRIGVNQERKMPRMKERVVAYSYHTNFRNTHIYSSMIKPIYIYCDEYSSDHILRAIELARQEKSEIQDSIAIFPIKSPMEILDMVSQINTIYIDNEFNVISFE